MGSNPCNCLPRTSASSSSATRASGLVCNPTMRTPTWSRARNSVRLIFGFSNVVRQTTGNLEAKATPWYGPYCDLSFTCFPNSASWFSPGGFFRSLERLESVAFGQTRKRSLASCDAHIFNGLLNIGQPQHTKEEFVGRKEKGCVGSAHPSHPLMFSGESRFA